MAAASSLSVHSTRSSTSFSHSSTPSRVVIPESSSCSEECSWAASQQHYSFFNNNDIKQSKASWSTSFLLSSTVIADKITLDKLRNLMI